MASLEYSKKIVNDYWLKKYGKIDKNDDDYNMLLDWAIAKAFNSRRHVTMDMLYTYMGDEPLVRKATPPSLHSTPPSAKPSMLKTSLAFMYPLFGKKDGRGTIKKDDQELYESMRSWVNKQVIIESYG
jgi:hypothetical protein